MSSANILISGVGGQGTLLASKIIGNAAIESGYDVKVSEVHGMAQRGGSVVTYVRYSKEAVSSPIIEKGEADIVLAFELLEGCRSVGYLKKGGRMIINAQEINPMPVIMGAASYPERIMEKIAETGAFAETVNAAELSVKAGSEKAVNVVMIGKMARLTGIHKDVWLEVIKRVVKPKFAGVNTEAFLLGYDA